MNSASDQIVSTTKHVLDKYELLFFRREDIDISDLDEFGSILIETAQKLESLSENVKSERGDIIFLEVIVETIYYINLLWKTPSKEIFLQIKKLAGDKEFLRKRLEVEING